MLLFKISGAFSFVILKIMNSLDLIQEYGLVGAFDSLCMLYGDNAALLFESPHDSNNDDFFSEVGDQILTTTSEYANNDNDSNSDSNDNNNCNSVLSCDSTPNEISYLELQASSQV